MRKDLNLTLISVAAGLAAAFLAINLFDRSGTPQVTLAPARPAITQESGPVSYAAAVEKAAPSVVNIYTTKVTLERSQGVFADPLLQYLFGDRLKSRPHKRRENSLGSGVVIGSDGYILTNNHVIEEADEINVVLSNGRSLEARVAGADPDTDLAVLRTEANDLPAITVGDSESLRVGDVVLAIGNPFGVGQTVTMGIVSATGRNQLGINAYENFIQTDAAINPGNSGGALINAYGELVGINSAIFSKSGGSMGIGFAIPATLAKGVLGQILDKGRVTRGWLGISGQDMTPELAASFGLKDARGVLVSGVLQESPADQAGIEPGDIILLINNRVPHSAHDILDIISTLPPGSKVEIIGQRGDKQFRTEAEVSERPKMR